MNDRIKELWEQAVHDDGLNTSVIDVFAELIVRECLTQIFCDGEDEYRITDSIYERIEKHFGVE